MRAVERDRLETLVPRWLGFAQVVRHLLPGVYVKGAARSFKTELADLRRARAKR